MEERTVLQAKRLGIVSCRSHQLLETIVPSMADNDISALVVVDDKGYLSGIITRSDLLRARAESPDWRKEPVGRFMTGNVVTVAPETLLAEVVQILLNKHIHRVVVVHGKESQRRPIAVLSDSDLICEMAGEVEA